MPKAIVTVGISASGKTTWANEFCRKNGYLNINRDNVRFSLFGSENWSQYKFKGANENLVTETCDAQIKAAAKSGRNIVVSDTNLSNKYRTQLINKLKRLGYNVQIKDFPIEFNEALKRDTLRANGVGRKVLYNQWKTWLEYTGRYRYIPDMDLPKAAIFDMDGTLARMTERKPFDWHRVGEDEGNFHVIDMLEGYRLMGYKIIIMSGRDGICMPETKEWLDRFRVRYDEIHMRSPNDMRPDTVIKEELFRTFVEDKYNVQVVVDDRTCMVDLWNDMGMNVISVGDHRDEF